MPNGLRANWGRRSMRLMPMENRRRDVMMIPSSVLRKKKKKKTVWSHDESRRARKHHGLMLTNDRQVEAIPCLLGRFPPEGRAGLLAESKSLKATTDYYVGIGTWPRYRPDLN